MHSVRKDEPKQLGLTGDRNEGTALPAPIVQLRPGASEKDLAPARRTGTLCPARAGHSLPGR